MERSGEKQPGEENAVPHSRLDRARRLSAAMRARAQFLSERAQAERGRHSSVDAAFEMVDRDSEVGGGILAGALAYRLFIYLLPLVLVMIVGLGVAADATHTTPEKASRSIGLAGLAVGSITSAAKSSTRWYALLIGIPVLVLAARSLLRTLIGVHRLAWADLRAAAPKPTMLETVKFLGLLLSFYVLSGLASTVRAHSTGLGLLVSIAVYFGYAGLWLVISARLPHDDAPWKALIPGALFLALGVEFFHLVTVYILAPYAISKQGAYGAVGAAAVLLLGFYLVGRLVIGAAVINVTLWERQARAPTTNESDNHTTGHDIASGRGAA